MFICLGRGANDLHMDGPADATATPIMSCFIKMQNGFAFLLQSYPGCLGKRAVKWVFFSAFSCGTSP